MNCMNNNFNMNNYNNNYNNMNDNLNFNSNNNENFINMNNQNNDLKDEEIFLTFTFYNHIYNKPIYIGINQFSSFYDLISELEDKYFWIKLIKNKKYYYNNYEINNLNISINKLGLSDDSNIIIKIQDNY